MACGDFPSFFESSVETCALLLHLVARSPPFAAALRPELCGGTCFIARACRSAEYAVTTRTLRGTPERQAASLMVARLAGAFIQMEDAAEGTAAAAVWRQAIGTPELCGVMLLTAGLWDWDLPGCSPGHLVSLLLPAEGWLKAQLVRDVAPLADGGHSALVMRGVLNVAAHHRSSECRTHIFNVALALWPLLSSAEQSRSFLDIAAFTRSILDSALEAQLGAEARSSPSNAGGGAGSSSAAGGRSAAGGSSSRSSAERRRSGALRPPDSDPASHSVGDADWAAAAADPHEATSKALLLLTNCMVPATALQGHRGILYGRFQDAASWPSGLQSRAKWLLVGRVLDICEALLRGAGRRSSGPLSQLARVTCVAAITVAASLLGGPPAPAAAAAAAVLFLTASLRKVLTLPAEARCAVTRAASGAANASASTSNASHNAAYAALDASVTVVYELMCHGLLRSRCEEGWKVANLLLRCSLVQLLPLAAHGAAVLLAAAPLEWTLHPTVYYQLLAAVAAANAAGMAAVTAAAGATTFLRELLSATVHHAVGGSDNTAQYWVHTFGTLAAATMMAASTDPAWRAASRRLDPALASHVKACWETQRREDADHGSECADDPATHWTELAAPGLILRLQSEGAAEVAARSWAEVCGAQLAEAIAPGASGARDPRQTLDGLMLQTAQQHSSSRRSDSGGASSSVGCLAAAAFGCWHRRCVNLEGASEAKLKLRKCAGCRLARYCSADCQRRSWRAGHRAACLAWQLSSGMQDLRREEAT